MKGPAPTRRAATGLVVGTLLTFGMAEPAGAVNWRESRLVTVIAVDYRFEPHRLVFRRGIPYRLHLVNRSSEWHEFTAPEFIKSIEIGNPKALGDSIDQVAVRPHREANLYFVARRPGRYRFYCADHDWAGMVGSIIVR